MSDRRLKNPALFICDLQEKFRKPISNFDKVLLTAQKMLKAADVLDIPVYVTTQNRIRLGETCTELSLDKAVEHVDKTAFSMLVPEIAKHFSPDKAARIAIVGIETHICVTQTARDLLFNGHKVYIIADGVSSCNPEETRIALDRLRSLGATITTSESFIYECMGDAKIPEFKAIAGLVKETSASTKETLQTLFP